MSAAGLAERIGVFALFAALAAAGALPLARGGPQPGTTTGDLDGMLNCM